ncbi:hypothetical protein QWY93_13540 [Echinicola jeungdonensis]|uniref:SatD family (SatD) n=1 Tax=Echinicola jeungdonensis TaxID=709343 RepID=A0ABV5JAK5_9BACT|nr:hypothetical protein [Echinicola jeungdonensis]MDN3670295.1 hypothetical protein [Echinicola jeungdonensis]MDN3670341.1 hypothetical protein [Echinicola jeungdonensis]
MVAIILGEVVGPVNTTRNHWFSFLKEQLGVIITPPDQWKISKEVGFRLEIQNPEEAFLRVIQIKSSIKKKKNMDVRLAIGIGEKKSEIIDITPGQLTAEDYAESIRIALKKHKINLGIQSDFQDWDETMNLIFRLALLIMDKWSVSSAELVNMLCWERDLLQEQIARRLGIKQAAVSQRYSRAEAGLIFDLEKYFRQKTASILVS